MQTIPRATYRLQLHRDFGFAAATAIIPYLSQLGISHLYCSPYFRARPGSTHGYDVVDHNSFNPEIGTREEFERFVSTLRAHGMGHILDIVPNHVGIMGADNRWWMDVLQYGQDSQYAEFFDIDWQSADPAYAGKVLVPVLGDSYGNVLESGELQLRHEPATADCDENFAVYYHEHRFPLNPRDYPKAREALASAAQPDANALHELLEAQSFRLTYWRLAADEVNYRRFFDINDLAALRMENAAVFAATHRLIFELLAAGQLDGLRIDHADGLYDPAGYFKRLQAQYAALPARQDGPLYLLVEKITARYERLPLTWPVSGTTGYDFANLVNGLFVDPAGRGRILRIYRAFLGDAVDREGADWADTVFAAKQLILRSSLASEVTVLAKQLLRIAHADRRTRDVSLNTLRQALRDVIACFPVYRTYICAQGLTAEDERYIRWAVTLARKRSQATDIAIFDFLERSLLCETLPDAPATLPQQLRSFAMKVQQVTAPAAAKGVEDTAFYRFYPLASLNEVGGDPDNFGVSIAVFHRENAYRARHWPYSMLASSTHDTKRAEDVRARIDVLSETPALWRRSLARWHKLNRSQRMQLDGETAPAAQDEYLFYQTLLGSWPLDDPNDLTLPAYRERIAEYLVKAAREAKLRTSWLNVNGAYEQALRQFVHGVLAKRSDNLFLDDFTAVQSRIAAAGMLNSLSQTLLKLTAPGVPDIYQGCELWDLSLVDPDNRRAVDFESRQRYLQELQQWNRLPHAQLQSQVRELMQTGRDGQAKLYLTWRCLELRRAQPDLFATGRYIPLRTTGAHAKRICAFARRLDNAISISIAPRLFARLLPADSGDFASIDWQDSTVALPPGAFDALRNVLDGSTVNASAGTVLLRDVLRHFPVALLSTENLQIP